MENISFNKRLQESFVRNWGLPALSNYQGITLTYSDIARRISKLHIKEQYSWCCYRIELRNRLRC